MRAERLFFGGVPIIKRASGASTLLHLCSRGTDGRTPDHLKGDRGSFRLTNPIPCIVCARVCRLWSVSAAQRKREVAHRGVDPLPQAVDSHQIARCRVFVFACMLCVVPSRRCLSLAALVLFPWSDTALRSSRALVGELWRCILVVCGRVRVVTFGSIVCVCVCVCVLQI